MRRLVSATLLVCTLASSALANSAGQDVVRHHGDSVAVNTFGNCVRTKWSAPNDACAPKAAPAPAPAPVAAPSPARQLRQEQRTVYFEFNQARLLQSEQQKLDTLAGILRSDQSVRAVRIVGYADRIGSTDYNDKLSQRRTQTVEGYLHERGYMNTSRAQTRWLGEGAPITQCDDKLPRAELVACLQKDRRVEVEIEYVQ